MRTVNNTIEMVIFIDDDPKKDLELLDCLYNLKNKGEIDYKLDDKEHKLTIRSATKQTRPVINDKILSFYVDKNRVFYGDDNSDEKLVSYKDWWSNVILTTYKSYLESNKVSSIWNKIEDYGEGLFTSTWKSTNEWRNF